MSEPPAIVLVTADLFFGSKLQGTAVQCGIPLRMVSSIEACDPGLECRTVIVDLELPGFDPADFVERLAAPGRRIVGYGSHVRTALFEAARAAGFDELLSRGGLSTNLTERLAAWGS